MDSKFFRKYADLIESVEQDKTNEGLIGNTLKSVGQKVMRHADVSGYTKAKQNFTNWIDSHPDLASHKENLLAKFDIQANDDPHTPWEWGKEALANWKAEQRSSATQNSLS